MVVIKGSSNNDEITVDQFGKDDMDKARAPFELDNIARFQVRGAAGDDVIHNKSAVSALLDGDGGDTIRKLDGDDIIATEIADADVLVGGAEPDALFTSGTNTFILADHQVDEMGRLIAVDESIDGDLVIVNAAHDRDVVSKPKITSVGKDKIGGAGCGDAEVYTDAGEIGVICWLRALFRFEQRPILAGPDGAQQRVLHLVAPPKPNETIDLGVVTQVDLDHLNLARAGSLGYSFQPMHTGTLTVEAQYDVLDGTTQLALFDVDSNMLATSNVGSGLERIDFEVFAEETYRLALHGDSPSVDLSLTNLVTMNSPLTVHGTNGDDSFEFVAGETIEITVNGVRYEFAAANVPSVTFLGGLGNDEVTLTGSNGDETARLYPSWLRLSGPGYEVRAEDVERSVVHSGSGERDRAYLYDSTSNDRFYGRPGESRLVGDGFENTVYGFDHVLTYAVAGGEDDRAFLHDSPGNDRFYEWSEYSMLRGADFEYFNYASGFDRVYGFATAGGEDDRAYLRGSSGENWYCEWPTYSVLRREKVEYSNHLTQYVRVYGFATAGGKDDRAYLHDLAGNDMLYGRPGYRELWDVDPEHNFTDVVDRVYAYATAVGFRNEAESHGPVGHNVDIDALKTAADYVLSLDERWMFALQEFTLPPNIHD